MTTVHTLALDGAVESPVGKGEQQTGSCGFDACISVEIKTGYREQPQTVITRRNKQKKQI